MPLDYLDHSIEKCDGEEIFITDSTGISTDRYKEVTRVLKETKERVYLKLHILVKYYSKGYIPIMSAKVTEYKKFSYIMGAD